MFLPVIAILAFQFPGGAGSPQEQMGQQVHDLRDETKDSVPLYIEMFKNGISAEALSKLGDEFLKYSKPEQAQICFRAALKLKPELDAAKAGLKKSTARTDELFARINEYLEKKTKEKDFKYGCRSSAILFYLGRRQEAQDMLRELAREFGPNGEMAGLLRTFKMGETVQMNTERQLSREFVQAVADKDLDQALERYGHLIFLSLGQVPSDVYIERLKEGFAEKVDVEKVRQTADLLIQKNS